MTKIFRFVSLILVAVSIFLVVFLSIWYFSVYSPEKVQKSGMALDGVDIAFKKEVTREDMDRVADSIGGKIVFIDEFNTAAVDIPARKDYHELTELILQLEKFPEVEYAKPDYYGPPPMW